MFNCYLKNPINVIVTDPKSGKNLHTFVFLGDIPANVKNSLYSYKAVLDKTGNTNSAAKHISILKEYYGPNWSKKLGLSKSGGDATQSEWSGGCIDNATQSILIGGNDDLLGIDLSEIDKMLNLESAESDADIDNVGSANKKELQEDDFIYTEEEDADRTQKVSIVDTNVDFRAKFSRNGGVTFVNDVKIYPEDKLYDVKQKIHIAIGIPFYRSHLYWMQNGRPMTTYKIITNGLYPVDIRMLSEKSSNTQEMMGVNIDRVLYNERNELKIEANDTFEIVANLNNWNETFYVCDVADCIEPIRSQLMNMVRDKYQLDLFYFGFIVKYWPQMVYEAFTEYILSESTLMQKFPDLSVPVSHLKKVYSTEAEILDKNYKNVKKIMDLDRGEGRKRIYIAVTHAIATSKLEYKMVVNVRNIFDKLQASKYYPEIKAYVNHDGKDYLLEKSYTINVNNVGNAPIMFPTGMKSGVIIAVNMSNTGRYMFVNIQNSGKYLIKTTWNEEDEYQLSDVLREMKKYTDNLFSMLNSMGSYIFVLDVTGKGFPYITESTVKYQSVNVSILWKHVMSLNAYRFVKSLWDPYIKAGIMSSHGISQMDSTNFIFHKGMIQFDTSLIYRVTVAAHIVSSRNQYARLTNSTIKQKWNQLYGGRIFKMYHRTTDIKFESVNVREDEFKLIYRYILMFVSKAMCNPRISQINAEKTFQVGNEGIKKLRKLQETDPDLYNLKKFGSNKMYSILCQNPRQPIIYTDDEIERMSNKDKSKLTKYWNFTLDREAYYGCENPKYPHMSFIVGVHPKNYCLPCCSKKQFAVEDSKKMQINKICMENLEFNKGDKLKEISSRHIMVYGKAVEPGRISQLPGSAIRDLLYDSLDDPALQYYIFGVPQSFPSVKNVGLIYALAESLSMTPQKLVSDMISHLTSIKAVFNTLLNGTISTEFKNMKDLTDTMQALFITRTDSDFTKTFNNWSELFTELAMIFLNIYIFTFIDDTERGETTDLYISDAMKSELMYMHRFYENQQTDVSTKSASTKSASNGKYLLMIKKGAEYYPIFVINSQLYFRTNTPNKKLFSDSDDVVKLLYSLVSSTSIAQANISGEAMINKPITLQVVKDFIENTSGYSITSKYINKRNLCYAVSLSMTSSSAAVRQNVYVPVEYSPHISDGIKINFDAPTEFSGADAVIKYVEDMNKFIKKKYIVAKSNSASNQRDMYEYSTIQFVKLNSYKNKISSAESNNGYIHYFSPITESAAEATFKKFSPTIVKLNYSYEEINESISKSIPAQSPKNDLINKALYNNHLYQLFVIEFVNTIIKEVNEKLRSELIKLISSTDFKKSFLQFQSKISEMLEEYPDDLTTLKSQISTFYYGDFDKKKLINEVKYTRYQFDNMTINSLKKMNINEIKAELTNIAKGIVSETDISSDGKFPNVYLPCSSSGQNTGQSMEPRSNIIYCDDSHGGNKLIVGNKLPILIDILASDITNPLKEKYLLSGIFDDNIIEFFDFIIRSTETITITRIE